MAGIGPREPLSETTPPALPGVKKEEKTSGARSFWENKTAPKTDLTTRKITITPKTYKNEMSIALEPIKGYNRSDIVEVGGYALVIDEVLAEIEARGETKEYTHPYTGVKLTDEEFGKIQQHPKAKAQLAAIEKKAKLLPKDITENTFKEVKELALTLSSYGLDLEEKEIGNKEFAEKEEASKLDAFDSYYKQLPPKEKKALDNLKIGLFTFKDTYEELLTNATCRRGVAIDCWKTINKYAPHLLPPEVAEKAKSLKGSAFDAWLHDYIPS